MSFGLTFIATSASKTAHQRWRDEDRARRERMDRHQKLTWLTDNDIPADEQTVLNEIKAQLGEEPIISSRNCPECQRPFARVQLEKIEIDGCWFCMGIWFDPGELQTLTGIENEVPPQEKTTRPSRHQCPDCQQTMIEYVLMPPLNLLVDRCPEGHGVYLEDRELERVFEIT